MCKSENNWPMIYLLKIRFSCSQDVLNWMDWIKIFLAFIAFKLQFCNLNIKLVSFPKSKITQTWIFSHFLLYFQKYIRYKDIQYPSKSVRPFVICGPSFHPKNFDVIPSKRKACQQNFSLYKFILFCHP